MTTTTSTVAVDADALERLVHLAHQINRDVAAVAIQEAPFECTCGHHLGPNFDPEIDPVGAVQCATTARAKHAAHLAWHVRQALAGRIEFP